MGPYKSKYEQRVAAWLAENKIPFDYEDKELPWFHKPHRAFCRVCKSKDVISERRYNPDFHIYPNGRLNPKGSFYLETKGKFTSADRTKMLGVIEANPQYQFRLLFMRDNKLNKRSKIRYSDWCSRHGIMYAIGEKLPEGWVEKIKLKAKVVPFRRKNG